LARIDPAHTRSSSQSFRTINSACKGATLKLNLREFAAMGVLASFLILIPAFAQDTGADIYTEKCKTCHGADGVGDTPIGKMAKIASFKDPSVVKASDADLIAMIKNGKNKMPAYAGKLTDDQITSVVAYIRTLQK
jgi:mono/diheme cytochrome c family protein